MARITIDDCLKIIPNRFDLTLSATARARQIANGAVPMLEVNRDKPAVIALRELAAGKYGIEILAENRTDAESVPAGAAAPEDAWRRITETKNRTDAESVPADPAAHEHAWRRITQTAGETTKAEVVSA